jgi:hypothetical protein
LMRPMELAELSRELARLTAQELAAAAFLDEQARGTPHAPKGDLDPLAAAAFAKIHRHHAQSLSERIDALPPLLREEPPQLQTPEGPEDFLAMLRSMRTAYRDLARRGLELPYSDLELALVLRHLSLDLAFEARVFGKSAPGPRT